MKITKSTKIIRKTGVFAVCIILGMTAFSFADIMPENSHSVERCVKISENLDFQDQNITLKAKITGPMIDSGEKIENLAYDTCLSKGYKFNQLSVLLEKDGEIQDLGILETWGGYVNDRNPINGENVVYQIKKEKGEYQLEKIFESESIHSVLFDKNDPYAEISKKHDEKNLIRISFDSDSARAFVVALGLTLVIEICVLFLIIKGFFRKYFREDILSRKDILFAGTFCSSTTLPYLWFASEYFHELWNGHYELMVMIFLEICVMVLEMFLLRKLLHISRKKSLFLSLVANVISFVGGGLLMIMVMY